MAAASSSSNTRRDDYDEKTNTRRDDYDEKTNNSVKFTSVKHLAEVLSVKELPSNYILPVAERPNANITVGTPLEYDLPVIDISGLEGPHRPKVVSAIGRACQENGFFQVINHGVEDSLIGEVMRVASEFFQLPIEERDRFASGDTMKAVRYGTSLNHMRDRVLCWRDFLKHYCHPLDQMLRLWPSNPSDYRSVVSSYSKDVRRLFVRIMSAVVESLGLPHNKYIVENGFSDEGSQVMVLNYYPACPEPELTLGIPPHSDYGCITVLAQDSTGGFQVLHKGQWEAIRPLPKSLTINIGDHIEVLSNGRYKSVMHRAVVNSEKPRISVAAFMSLPLEANICPAPELTDEHHPPMYRDTNFAELMNLLTSNEYRAGSFLDSIRLNVRDIK
eukprot:PITA_01968